MKVAICSDGVFPATVGGIQRHTRLLVETLAREHPSLHLVVVHPHPGQTLFPGLDRVEEVTVEPRPERHKYAAECYGLSRRMAEVVRGIPDAVVYSQGLTGWAGAKSLGPRLIVNPHGLEPFQCHTVVDRLKSWPVRVGLRQCFRHAAAVVSLGGGLTDILRKHVPDPNNRICTIPNGVELPADQAPPRPAAEAELRLLFVGRFAPNKGIPDLLEAVQLVEDRSIGVRLYLDLVGTGPLWADLVRQPHSDAVRYHGAVNDAELQRLYAAADVFVLPTHFEGMPTVVLEAMARGLPIVVSDVGATRDLVDSTNGFLVPPRRPSVLADRIVACAVMPRERLRALGAASLAKARTQFSWTEVARRHVALFERTYATMRRESRSSAAV